MTAQPSAPSRRRILLAGCALAGFLAAPNGEALAQGFNATPTVVAGGVDIDRTAGTDVVTISTPSAIINWRMFPPVSFPGPDPNVFLPEGNFGIFQNGANNPDFAVLNRIFPTGQSPIRFDGTVIGRIQTQDAIRAGGTVLFVSPTGIIVGRTAVFDVGNLLLTSLDPFVDANDEFFVDGQLQLRGGENNPTSAVVTEAGASISALGEGSWFAMVAPRVEHGGTARVNGSVAYVAAQSVDLRIDQGLFDINVIFGTDEAIPLVHRGSTGGPASSGAGDNHGIYMVAAPRNQAITALLEGQVGFDSATVAGVENGAIVLSAGHNVVGGAIDETTVFFTPEASFEIRGGRLTSDVTGFAVTDFLAGGTGPGSLIFEQDVSLHAFRRASMSAGGGYLLRVEGNASLSAANLFPRFPGADPNVTGGSAAITSLSGGRIEIVGNARVDSSAVGGVSETLEAGTGTGGLSSVLADKGSITIGGDLTVLATGTGASGGGGQQGGGGEGSAGVGGDANATATSGGTLSVGGNVRLDSSGTATARSGAEPGPGADGTGGDSILAATGGGSLTVRGTTTLVSAGTGGELQGGTGAGGAGQGGLAALVVNGGTMDLTGAASLSANGAGGSGPAGGAGTGGTASIDSTEGTIALGAGLDVQAQGRGGAATAAGGRGGDGSAGDARVAAHSGASEGSITGAAAVLSASGMGGTGGAGGRGGDGLGRSAIVTADASNGRLQLGAVTAQANGTGGAGAAGGNGRAGSVLAGTVPDQVSQTTAGSAAFASLALSASAAGGAGSPGGTADAGTVRLVSTGAPVTVTGVATLTADAAGGVSPAGVRSTADGGELLIEASARGGTAGSLTVGTLNGSAVALGDSSTLNGLGRWRILSDRSAIALGNATLSATATGAPAILTQSDITLVEGTVTVAGAATLGSAGPVRIAANGTGRLNGGAIAITSGSGITIAHAARPAGGLTVDAATFTATTTGNFTAEAGTAVTGRNLVAITAGGVATLAGSVAGAEIRVTSADIVVPGGASVGNAGTGLLLLQSQPSAVLTTVGGAAQGPGYTLTQDEAARIRAGTLRVATLAGPGIQVRDLTLAGGGAGSGVSAFELATPGTVRVEGALLLANAAAADRIGIAAGGRVEVAIPGGSIRVRDGAGSPAGTLAIAGSDIWVTDAAIAAQLAADPNFPSRDLALRTVAGAEVPRGYVEAGAVRLSPGSTLFVQNSGNAINFAGITVGPGGLEIVPSGAQPAIVYAFGRRLNIDGTYLTGRAFFGQVDFNRGDPPGYTNASEFNRCIINSGLCPSAFGNVPGSSSVFLRGPTREQIEGSADDEIDDSLFDAEPLIEEPVTSGSDSTLWVGPDDDDDDDDEDEDEDPEEQAE
ncbi:beta strand repeat-containing protein [Allosphingosinicella sp.]|uniref:beta strand repeat-containing protein n=1 Tax=Allosphingosinicella sp. TaxID=2823234 RepID=UPI002EEACCC8